MKSENGVLLPGRFGLILAREPTGFCAVCDVPFYSDRDVRAHFSTAEHRDAIEREMEARRAQKARVPFMYEDSDPEVAAHMEQVGKRMKAEGRWDVKPSERAGFS